MGAKERALPDLDDEIPVSMLPPRTPVRADFYTPFAPPKIARTPSAPHNQGYQRSRADTSQHATPSEKHASDQGLLLEILVRERRGWDLNPR